MVTVKLPVMPPVSPMLAKLTRELPVGDYLYEPKWDGFRCIVFRDGDEVELGSRNERPLTRYFPEVVADGDRRAAGSVRDRRRDRHRRHRTGWTSTRSSSGSIRPRRGCDMLAERTPASFVAFDLLALGDSDLRDTAFGARRDALVGALRRSRPPVHLTPATTDAATASDWFARFEGAGLDGVVAKGLDLPYREDERAMWKVKHERTADFVVAGFRWHKSGQGVGSLMLGLYDDEAVLHHVGVIGAFRRPASAWRWSTSWRPTAISATSPIRGESGPRGPRPDRGASGQRLPGAVESVERHQGSELRAPPPRAGRRGRLRAPPGRPACATPPSSAAGGPTATR